MERIEVSTVTRQFKRTFDEGMLNELGKRTRLCQRERTVTPFRLALSLIEVFASPRVPCIADLHRGFNALCEEVFVTSRFTISWPREGLHSLCESCRANCLMS